MTARSEAMRPESDPIQGPKSTEALMVALRSSASSAVEIVNGGVALVFVSALPEDPKSACLRVATGFGNANEARGAAEVLLPRVLEVTGAGTVGNVGPIESLGDRAAGGLIIHPLVCGELVHGALAVGSPATPDAMQTRMIAIVASELSLRLSNERLTRALDSAGPNGAVPEEEHADEMLKLSEALFAQDIALLRNNEKLEKIDRLKNDFIEKMSCELRTPLNSIIESIISVLSGENDALSEEAKASLRSALDEGTAFLRTLQNILDLWRIKQRELPVEIQDVNFRELIDEAIFSVQDAIGDSNVRVEQSLKEPFPKIRTDLTKLNQILLLLLDNAAKFTHRGTIKIDARLEENQLICEVRDTGIGICQDDQQWLFDEFYQVDELSSQRYAGAGLGLSLVRDLVALLDGEISLSSEVGVGTLVGFRIPVQAV